MKAKTLSAALGILAGVSVGQFWLVPDVWVLVYLFVVATFAGVALFKFKKEWSTIAWLFFIFLIIGNWRLAAMRNDNQLNFWLDKSVSFEGYIVNDSYLGATDTNAIIKLNLLESLVADGKIITKLPTQNYQYGDSLNVLCKLSWPENTGYAAYLKRLGVGAVCNDPYIEKLGENKGSFIQKSLINLKHTFISRIKRVIPAPASGLLSGLLLGDKTSLSDRTLNSFNNTGLTHIIALSGFNITIIIGALLLLLGWLPLVFRYIVAATVVLAFVLLTGAEPSVVRAAIMAGFIMLAMLSGRINDVAVSLGLTAAIMTLFNPEILFGDAGFQLSFIATLGIIYLSPVLEITFRKIPQQISTYLIPTLAAIIAVTPIIAINFDRVSLIAPISNLLVLPVIPGTMLIGFIALILSWVNIYIAQAIGLIAWIFLKWILWVAEMFGGFSFLSISVDWFNLFFAILYYVIVTIFIWRKYVQENQLASSNMDSSIDNS
ncbi:MAG: ComEC/Rec2 family competence protein [Patescibacteria group bacterium]|nr:ComEC/Rec2 family competence protein [Patescibacteria group bacterium]